MSHILLMINFDHFKDAQQTAAVTHKSSFTGVVLVCLTWCLIRKKKVFRIANCCVMQYLLSVAKV